MMRLPIVTARAWTGGRWLIAPGWLLVEWAGTTWTLACYSCGRLTWGCRDHWWCGLCQRCATSQEEAR